MIEKSWPYWSSTSLEKKSSIISLSMIEKSWPYWSADLLFRNWRFHCFLSMIEKSWPYWSNRFSTERCFSFYSIHDWKIMALLKPGLLTGSKPCLFPIHDWKIMALLKRPWWIYTRFQVLCYPWLKNHGPIEAEPLPLLVRRALSIHDWKIMALLKH